MNLRIRLPLILLTISTVWLAGLVRAETVDPASNITITGPTANVTVKPGYAARMTVKAAGGVTPLKYQWYFSLDGTGNVTALTSSRQITGVTTPSLSIGGTNTTNVGTYFVAVTDSANNTANSTLCTLSFTGTVPVITSFKTSPANLTLALGKSVTFTAIAKSTPTPALQWLMNGANITGATRNTYSIAKVTTEMNGAHYSVFAYNAIGNVTSTPPAILTVTGGVGPSITTQPSNQTVASGGTAKFSVVAAGSPTLLYQWYFGATALVNGKDVAGATTAKLTISKVSDDDVGNYSVMVLNGINNVTSNIANLTLSE
ncbi:MAG: immunoglobulin domain-containing protein [Opitutales bacterium]|jgi:hypothetical protein